MGETTDGEWNTKGWDNLMGQTLTIERETQSPDAEKKLRDRALYSKLLDQPTDGFGDARVDIASLRMDLRQIVGELIFVLIGPTESARVGAELAAHGFRRHQIDKYLSASEALASA